MANTTGGSGAHQARPPSPWYLRYVMVMAFLIVAVSLMDRYVVSILMEQIKADLSLSDTQLGLLVGPAFVIVHILSQLPLARIADRSNRRSMIAAAMALWSLFTVAAGFARNFVQLFITRMGVGITEAACAPPLASLLTDQFPPERRARAQSMLSIGGVAGIGAGMLVGGIVGQAYGWRVALIAAGIPGVLLALIVRLTVREPPRGGAPGADAGEFSLRQSLRYLAGNRTYRWMVLGTGLAMVCGIGRGAWEPVFLMRVYDLDQARAGITYFLISPLPSILGAYLGGVAVDRLGIRDARWALWVPALSALLSFPLMVGFLLWPVGHSLFGGLLPVGFAFSILGSVASAMLSPGIIATGQSLAPPGMRALSHAIWTMAANLVGMGLGPLATGWFSDALAPTYGDESIRFALVIVSTVAIPAAIALLVAARSARADLAAAGASAGRS